MSHVSREILFEQVWAEPMTKVARRYEVSSSYLARVCRAFDIPRPGRGHWAKLAHGHHIRPPELPPSPPGAALGWHRGRALPESDHVVRVSARTGTLRPQSPFAPRPD